MGVAASSRRRWRDLSSGQRMVIGAAGVAQIALAGSAWRDLARRSSEDVRGPKALWACVIAVNFVGPAAYFRWGRVH